MSYIFSESLNYFAINLNYSSDYKILYLLYSNLCSFVVFFGLLFLKVLDLRSFRVN